jgi:hypothetical protein
MLILPTPHWLTANALLMNVATWGTLALELSIGILVWNKRFRPWVLAGGVVMHSLIMITIAVGFFAPATFVLYLAFIPAETVRRLPNTIKHVGAQLLAFLRRHRRTGDERHPGMPECHPADDDTPTRTPAQTPSHWIKASEPRRETIPTSPITNGADRFGGRSRLIEQRPPVILEVDRHLPVGGHGASISHPQAICSPSNTPEA